MNKQLEQLALQIGEAQARVADGAGSLGDGVKILRERIGAESELLLELYAAVQQLAPYDPPPPGGGPAELVEPFAPGSPYAYLPDVPSEATPLGWWPRWINSAGAGELFDLAEIEPGDYAGADDVSSWGDHGPPWAAQLYRAVGILEGVRLFRVGDFYKGREGHAVYLRPGPGDVELRDVEAIGCGGQHTQARVDSTEIPPEFWPRPGDTFTHTRARAIQCGAIQAGAAVRASWPRTFFNTGSRYRAVDCYTQTDHTGHAPAGATGAVFVGFGKEPRRCELVELAHEECALRGSDRAAVFLEGVDEARLEEPELHELDRDAARVRIVDGCGPVKILRPKAPILVEFAHENDKGGAAHRAPYRTELVPPGVDVWTS